MRTGTCDAKNSWEFSVDAIYIYIFYKIIFEKKGTFEYAVSLINRLP